MRTFLKENVDMIRKLIVFQVGMVIFALAVSTPMVRNTSLLVLSNCLAIGLHLFLIYTAMWELGSKDIIRIEQGRMQSNPLKGLYIGLCANALNIFLAIWVAIFKVFVLYPGATIWDYFNSPNLSQSPQWLYNLYTIPRMIINAFQMMYAGIFKEYLPNNPLVYLLALILPLLCCLLGYLLGLKNFKLFSPKKKEEQ